MILFYYYYNYQIMNVLADYHMTVITPTHVNHSIVDREYSLMNSLVYSELQY